MALDPIAFGPDSNDKLSQSDVRRRQLSSVLGRGGLSALFASNDDPNDLSKEPQNEGDTSSPIATPGFGKNEEPGAPSLLATERVQRAPNFLAATPLLGAEQRAGAAFGEAARGEEGVLGGGPGRQGLSTAARNHALMSFFRPDAAPQQSSEPAGPSDTSKAIGSAKSAVGAGSRASRLFGTSSSAYGDTIPTGFGDITLSARGGGLPGGAARTVEGDPNFDIGAGEGQPLSEGSSFSMPDFSKLGTYGSGLGLLGSLLGLAGNAAGNPTLAKAGAGAGVAGQGVNFASNPSIAGGAGLAGAGLGLAGSLAGEKDLSTAGNALSAIGSLYGLYSGLSSALASGAAGAGAGAGAGAAAGAGAGAASSAAGGAAATGAGLGAGAVGGMAGGVLAIPAIVKLLMDTFEPDYTDYSIHRRRSQDLGQAGSEIARGAYSRIPTGDLRTTFGALRSELVPNTRNAMRSSIDPAVAKQLGLSSGEWSDMTPQDFASAMQYLSADPSRLSAIRGSGDLPYLSPAGGANQYAENAQNAARALIARQLGLPYLDVHGGAGYGANDIPYYGNPEDVLGMASNEDAYMAARDAWQQAHPDVQLQAYNPVFSGHLEDLMRDIALNQAGRNWQTANTL